MNADNDYIGGIVGYCEVNQVTTSCQNHGLVSGYEYVGGICGGAVKTTVTLCENNVKIYGATGSVGGIVGYNNGGSVSYCQNSDSVISPQSTIGGIVGYMTDNSKRGIIHHCHNTGFVQGYNCIGGINGTCENSYVYICHNSGTVKTTSGTGGGIVGYAHYTYYNSTFFYNNYNKGIVNASGWAGGLIGDLNNHQSGYTIYVRNSYTTGDISGSSDVGGLIGISRGYITSSSHYNTYIQNCYHTGTVSDATNKGELTGELDQYSNIDHCYFHYTDTAKIDLVDKAVGYNSNASATWLRSFNDNQQLNDSNPIGDTTAVDLLSALNIWASQNNYSSWTVDSSVNNGLPYLTSFICATPVITQDSGKFVLTSATSSARIYYTLDHSTPTENSTLYSGPINTSDYSYITAVAMADGFLPSAYATLDCFTTLYTYGDVNNDGHIRTGDVVSIVNYILKKTPEVFIYRAADVNKDSIIDISDAVNVVGLILGTYQVPDKAPAASAPPLASMYASSASDLISGNGHDNALGISLTNRKAYTAFQLDIDLPAGVMVSKASLSQRADATHSLSFNKIDETTHRIVCFSLSNRMFRDNAGKLLELELSGSDNLPDGTYEVPVHNIRMSDEQGRTTTLNDAVLSLTVGAAPTEAATLQANGIIISGGNCLTVLSPEQRDIRIYGLDGRHVATLATQAGIATCMELPSGMYMVEGTKVTIIK